MEGTGSGGLLEEEAEPTAKRARPGGWVCRSPGCLGCPERQQLRRHPRDPKGKAFANPIEVELGSKTMPSQTRTCWWCGEFKPPGSREEEKAKRVAKLVEAAKDPLRQLELTGRAAQKVHHLHQPQ